MQTLRHRVGRWRLSLRQRSRMLAERRQAAPLPYAPQIHELEIAKYFTQAGTPVETQRYATPLPVRRQLVLCFLNRSGSNLLAEALHATGRLGLADEFFNYDRVFQRCERKNIRTFQDYIVSLTECHGTANNILAIKLSWDQLYFLTKLGAIPGMFNDPLFVLVKRRDLAAQAVSFLAAHKTGEWKSNWKSEYGHETPEFEIADEEICDMVRQLAFSEMQFRTYFALFGIEPLTVYYEELGTALEAIVSEILEALGEDGAIDHDKITVRKQRSGKKTQTLESFRQRYQLWEAGT